ncbi:MAG TPA: hypothetical protein VM802_05990 [Chitinophaga sp.]|uniref:hypothetical protein n=1 Tax=Chitinophaga sp. TaxID=1869181 RepID=UPI002BF90C1A|nr:hypothetical protein [Chitinophaga sp.]HVI44396.1 hypothetical protein [Chitinophaga sp.]
MWCLLSAPLLLGANVELLDDFTLSLITNEEVIAVNQDALGRAGRLVTVLPDSTEVWSKSLEDGGIAVGLLNPQAVEQHTTLFFDKLNLSGTYVVRDLWKKNNIASGRKDITVTIPSHGIILLKLMKSK